MATQIDPNQFGLTLAQAKLLARRRQGLRVGCVGGSMTPTLRPGQVVTVHRARPRVGDIIFIVGKTQILHRCVFYVPGLPWVVHKGDAPGSRLSLTYINNVVGVAE